MTPKDDVFQKCPIDSLRKIHTKLSNKIDDLVEVTNKIEESFLKQEIFGSNMEEDISIAKIALEIAEEYLSELDEEQSNFSRCLEESTIEWEENLAKCKIEERDDCDEIESFLEEVKKMKGRK